MTPLKIAHFGDIHLGALKGEVPEIKRWLGKRILGTSNLRFFGRGKHFLEARERFQLLLQDIVEQNPDYVISSGDFSAMSFPIEFKITSDMISDEFKPFLNRFSVVPGNHDRYTLGEIFSSKFDDYFLQWVKSDLDIPARSSKYTYIKIIDNAVALIFIDAVRFNPVARGKISKQCLLDVKNLLNIPQLKNLPVFFVIHYPPLGENGEILEFTHRCVGIWKLVNLAKQYNVKAFFAGHVHRNFIQRIPNSEIYSISAGSGTYSGRATYNIYEIEKNNAIVVDRKKLNEGNGKFETFAKEKLYFAKK